MKCTNCNRSVQYGNYCYNCGYPLNESVVNDCYYYTLEKAYEQWSTMHYRNISKLTKAGYISA